MALSARYLPSLTVAGFPSALVRIVLKRQEDLGVLALGDIKRLTDWYSMNPMSSTAR